MFDAGIFTGAIAGATAGVIADQATDQINKWQNGPRGEAREKLGDFLEHLADINKNLAKIEQNTRALIAAPEKYIISIPTSSSATIRTHGKPYNMMFCAAAVALTFTIPGIGSTQLSLQPGWNIVNMPDQTSVSQASGATSALNVYFMASTHSFGTAL